MKTSSFPHILNSIFSQKLCLSLLVAISFAFSAFSQNKTPLSISGYGHYFLDEKLQTLFWQGDTQWELFHLFSAAQSEGLLEERKKQGFNFIQVMATGVFPEWGQMKGVDFSSPQEAWLG